MGARTLNALPLALVGALAGLSGAAGYRLTPDSGLYAAGRLLPAHSLLAGVAGRVGGMAALIALSTLAAVLVLAQLPAGRARWLMLGLGGYWFAFPGADALGVAFVLRFASTGRGRWWLAAALAHPVAALASWPLFAWARWPFVLGMVGVCSTALVLLVGVLDAFSTTERYLLPLLALALARPGARSAEAVGAVASSGAAA